MGAREHGHTFCTSSVGKSIFKWPKTPASDRNSAHSPSALSMATGDVSFSSFTKHFFKKLQNAVTDRENCENWTGGTAVCVRTRARVLWCVCVCVGCVGCIGVGVSVCVCPALTRGDASCPHCRATPVDLGCTTPAPPPASFFEGRTLRNVQSSSPSQR